MKTLSLLSWNENQRKTFFCASSVWRKSVWRINGISHIRILIRELKGIDRSMYRSKKPQNSFIAYQENLIISRRIKTFQDSLLLWTKSEENNEECYGSVGNVTEKGLKHRSLMYCHGEEINIVEANFLL